MVVYYLCKHIKKKKNVLQCLFIVSHLRFREHCLRCYQFTKRKKNSDKEIRFLSNLVLQNSYHSQDTQIYFLQKSQPLLCVSTHFKMLKQPGSLQLQVHHCQYISYVYRFSCIGRATERLNPRKCFPYCTSNNGQFQKFSGKVEPEAHLDRIQSVELRYMSKLGSRIGYIVFRVAK